MINKVHFSHVSCVLTPRMTSESNGFSAFKVDYEAL